MLPSLVEANFCSRDGEEQKVRTATLTLLLEEQTRRHTAIPSAFPLKEVDTPKLAQWIRLLGSAKDERTKT